MVNKVTTQDLPLAPLLRPVKTQRASEAIYEQIRDLILQGQLKEGDRLPSERALMDQLSRSRPTIREALRMLERDGFIQTIPGGSGATVHIPTTNMVTQSLDTMLQLQHVTKDELGEFRIHNDAATARWAALRRSEADLDAMEAILAETLKCVEVLDWVRFMDLDPLFHLKLAQAGKNRVAAIMSEVLCERSKPICLAGFLNLSPEDAHERGLGVWQMHRNILDAVRDGDAQAAEEAMVYHIRQFIRQNP